MHRALPSIVCAVDRSRGAVTAARLAARLSRRLDLRLVLVHVCEPVAPHARARAQAQEVLEEIAWTQDLVGAELRPEAGPVAERLLEVAEQEEAYALVLGATDRRPLSHLFRERLPQTLGRRAPCAVVVAPRDP